MWVKNVQLKSEVILLSGWLLSLVNAKKNIN